MRGGGQQEVTWLSQKKTVWAQKTQKPEKSFRYGVCNIGKTHPVFTKKMFVFFLLHVYM